jgi:ribosomal protein S18 acetylase RimI-like enzyme
VNTGEQALDNPVHASLAGRHAHLALGDARALRFQPDYSVLAGVGGHTSAHTDALAALLAPGEDIAIISARPPPLPAHWQVLHALDLVQMIRRATSLLPEGDVDAAPLGTADTDAMLALVEATHPGPFRRRTVELGHFIGVRDGNRLVAMCGERLWIGDFREVSGVCTHPDALGRGVAAALMARTINRMVRAGQVPFLHVERGNARAIALYARLGFVERARLGVVVAQVPA